MLCFLQALCLLKIPRRGVAAQKDITCNVAIQSTRYCLMLIYIVYSLQKEANRTYNCENLGLREIPDTLPNMTEFLEFGFNFLPTIQNTTFSRLINLVFLDLTRYVCEVLCVCVCVCLMLYLDQNAACIQIVYRTFFGAQGQPAYSACFP